MVIRPWYGGMIVIRPYNRTHVMQDAQGRAPYIGALVYHALISASDQAKKNPLLCTHNRELKLIIKR